MGHGRSRKHRREASKRTSAPRLATSYLGHSNISTATHEERLDIVTRAIVDSGAKTVVDLGCGSGTLLQRLLAETQLTSIVGMDPSLPALRLARHLLLSDPVNEGRLSLIQGSVLSCNQPMSGFCAAAMVEIIEHIDPCDLAKVEQMLFATWRPSLVVVTTPNKEYNVLLDLGGSEYRHHDHRFEWTRSEFQSWAYQVADRNHYAVTFEEIGPVDSDLGSLTQMAVFRTEVLNDH